MRSRPYLQGWWGVKLAERFDMHHEADFMSGVKALQLSNPPVLQTVSLLGSLEVFSKTTMEDLRQKSLKLTGSHSINFLCMICPGYLEFLMDEMLNVRGLKPYV